MNPLDFVREYDRLVAELTRRQRENALLKRLLAALRADPGAVDGQRALFTQLLALLTPAELEERAAMFAALPWPDWMRDCFREAAARGAN